MKIKHPSNLNNHLARFRERFLALGLLLFATAGASAGTFYWDAGDPTNGAPADPGSGAWDTSAANTNWNYGGANVKWTQINTTSGTNIAVFNGPDAAPGTYSINVDAGQVSVTNITVNASGYAFSGSAIYIKAGLVPVFTITNGKSVVFNDLVTGNNGAAQMVLGDSGPPATVGFVGGITGMQWNITSTNGSTVYIGGNSSSGSSLFNANIIMTNGIFTATGIFQVGRATGSTLQAVNGTGSFTFDGPSTVFNETGDFIIIGRGTSATVPGIATLTIQNGATFNDQVTGADPGMGLPRVATDGGGPNYMSTVNVFGGTVNMGSGSIQAQPITMQDAGSYPGEVTVINQTNGVLNAWGGIVFGGTGTSRAGGTAIVTNTGGFLYLGAVGGDGLRAGLNLPPTNQIVFSGGTVGALQSWHSPSSLPITLGTLNGNITFQCADPNQTPYNITLDQALNGPGGFYKTGGGQLSLNGVNTYAGGTVISNGVLQLTTASTASSNGPVTLDGSAGSPEVRVIVSHQGQYWSAGTATFTGGSSTLDFQYGQFVPSLTKAAIHVNGDLNFTATPNIMITNATALAVGTYPLIQYSGIASGTAPTTVTLPVSGDCSGYVSNSVAAKTLYLVITSSTVALNLTWATCMDNWDFTTSDWSIGGNPSVYSDGKTVVFDDTAPCASPVVTLNTTVSPASVLFNNLTNAYAIVGNGSLAINSGGDLELVGGGTVSLATTNTWSGGAVVSAGSCLNLNSGGSGSGSPVGTGTLTLNSGARLGNSSGTPVALQYPVSELWNGSFSFVGGSDLNLGSGPVTLAENATINVVTNDLILDGSVSDNGAGNQLVKAGNGALTLATYNSWGSLQLQSGLLNLGTAGSAGSGSFTIFGGAVDNISGSELSLYNSSYVIHPASGTFTFLGSANLDFTSGTVDVNNGSTLTVDIVSNTWTTAAAAGQNTLITKTGDGIWAVSGSDAINNLVVTVNQGELDLARSAGSTAISGGGGTGSYGGKHGLVVNSNSVAKITGYGNQISHGASGVSAVEVVMNTGIFDLNGYYQTVDLLALNNGILRNSAPGSASTLTVESYGAVMLAGTNCGFDVPPVDATLFVAGIVNGSGTLVKTGLGNLTLQSSNSYTGNIIICAGTLELSYPDIAAGTTVAIATNAVLDLNFANGETNTVAGLVLNGVPAAAGIHNATTDPLYISGTGSLLVNAVTINPLPGTIQAGVSGGDLNLAWPTNAGWLLQAQTNSLQTGLGTNWVTVPGSDSLTNLSVPVNPANGATFYRMVHP